MPLIVTDGAGGRIFDGGVTSELVSSVDLFPTLLELEGVPLEGNVRDPSDIDGVSFVPLLESPATARSKRPDVYVEIFKPNGPGPYKHYHRAVFDGRWKLVEKQGAPDELYDLKDSLLEGEDLLRRHALDPEQQAAYDRLKQRMRAYLESA